jgi:hypothetical protein
MITFSSCRCCLKAVIASALHGFIGQPIRAAIKYAPVQLSTLRLSETIKISD